MTQPCKITSIAYNPQLDYLSLWVELPTGQQISCRANRQRAEDLRNFLMKILPMSSNLPATTSELFGEEE